MYTHLLECTLSSVKLRFIIPIRTIRTARLMSNNICYCWHSPVCPRLNSRTTSGWKQLSWAIWHFMCHVRCMCVTLRISEMRFTLMPISLKIQVEWIILWLRSFHLASLNPFITIFFPRCHNLSKMLVHGHIVMHDWFCTTAVAPYHAMTQRSPINPNSYLTNRSSSQSYYVLPCRFEISHPKCRPARRIPICSHLPYGHFPRIEAPTTDRANCMELWTKLLNFSHSYARSFLKTTRTAFVSASFVHSFSELSHRLISACIFLAFGSRPIPFLSHWGGALHFSRSPSHSLVHINSFTVEADSYL